MKIKLLIGIHKDKIVEVIRPFDAEDNAIYKVDGTVYIALEGSYEIVDENVMTPKEEVEQLLHLYKIKCFSLMCSADDTDVENDIMSDMNKLEMRIMELIKD